jgi:hypothetical protein
LDLVGKKVLGVFLLAIQYSQSSLLMGFSPLPLEQKWFGTGL